MLARPTGVMPDQLAYLHYVTLTILNALKRLPEMYLNDAEVRAVVPLTAAEESWLRDAWGPSQRDNNPVLGRLDGVIEFTSPMWKDSLKLLEPNLSGVGGIHLCPTAEQLLVDLVLPVLQQADPKLVMEQGQDLRELFIQEIARPSGGDRPQGAPRLLHRAEILRHGHRRAGPAGRILSPPPRPENHARRSGASFISATARFGTATARSISPIAITRSAI